MLRYPYALHARSVGHSPLFENLEGDPFPVDLSDGSPLCSAAVSGGQRSLNAFLAKKMAPRHTWGVGGYLECRRRMLQGYRQMVREERFYHLGIDIVVPLHAVLHAPLGGVVRETGREEGEGNYGGYVLLEHGHPAFETFFSFYGHLDPDTLKPEGTALRAGDPFARIGDFLQNGNWYHHTHLQIITQRGLAAGYLHKGYCSRKDLEAINAFCPDPLPLFII